MGVPGGRGLGIPLLFVMHTKDRCNVATRARVTRDALEETSQISAPLICPPNICRVLSLLVMQDITPPD